MTDFNDADRAGRPILFRAEFETVPSDEADTAAVIVEALRGTMETTAADYVRAVRASMLLPV